LAPATSTTTATSLPWEPPRGRQTAWWPARLLLLRRPNRRFAHTTNEGLKIRNSSMERDIGNCYHQHVSVADQREIKSNRKSTHSKERRGTNSSQLALWYHRKHNALRTYPHASVVLGQAVLQSSGMAHGFATYVEIDSNRTDCNEKMVHSRRLLRDQKKTYVKGRLRKEVEGY
jgi:hypothetical protein